MVDFQRAPIEGVVMLTPLCLHDDGTIDDDAIDSNIEWVEQQGLHGFIQLSSMGQGWAVNDVEFDRIVDRCVEASDDSTCIIGCIATTQRETIRRVTYAERAGADGAMVTLPYAFPVPEKAIAEFFGAVDGALAGEIALLIYNSPMLTDVSISPDTWRSDLLGIDSIKALKESNFSRFFYEDTLLTTVTELNFISSGDSFFWHDSQFGGVGFIGILSWVAPKLFSEFFERCSSGGHHDQWTVRANANIVRAMRRLISLPGTPPALLNALVEIGGRPAGPIRKPYRQLSTESGRALADAVQPLIEMEADL